MSSWKQIPERDRQAVLGAMGAFAETREGTARDIDRRTPEAYARDDKYTADMAAQLRAHARDERAMADAWKAAREALS